MAEAQLLDDSALVKALDDAISKYKIMHIKGDNGSLKEERITKHTEERGPDVSDRSIETKRYMKTDDNITDEPKNTTHTGVAADSSVTENSNSEVVEQLVSPSNGDQVQNTDAAYGDAESAERYNNLLNQYNAAEEQRQKILEQLYQYGNWDYQGYGYGAAYDTQYNTVPAPQTSEPPVCSCRPYVYPYPTTQHTSSAAVPSGETCAGSTSLTHNGNSVSLKDNAFIKETMGAVEKAIRSATKESSGTPYLEGKKGQEVDAGSRDVAQHKTSETDLSVVLNAWFSAGFYTGKYLSEQASAKK